MIIQRAAGTPAFRRYQDYKPYLRADFRHSCAYCLLHERQLLTDHWSFTIDHFRPKGLPRFRHLRNIYANLYYACPRCNTYKGNVWPARSTVARGSGFVDPCAQDPLNHFSFDAGGGIAPRTAAGAYTIRHLRLDRAQLERRRRELIDEAAQELKLFAEIESDRASFTAMRIRAKDKARLLASLDRHAQNCLRRLHRITHPDPTE
jgi:uncharacterized protein (TIGR02646 family)